MRYRFVVDVEATDPPPDYNEHLLKTLRREVGFCMPPGAVVNEQPEFSVPLPWGRSVTDV